MKLTKNIPLILLIVGAIVRFTGLGAAAIWYDEAYTLYLSRLPVMDIIRAEMASTINPPLWVLLVKPFTALGDSLWLLRMPSFLCSVLAMYVAWRLVVRLGFDNFQQSLMMAGIALMPGLIWTAQDARCYALLSVLYLLALAFAVDGCWTAMMIANLLMLYTHNIGAAFVIGVLGVALYVRPRAWRTILATMSMAMTLWLPWIIFQGRAVTGTGLAFEKLAFLGPFYSLSFAFLTESPSPVIIMILLVAIPFSLAAMLTKKIKGVRPAVVLIIPTALPFVVLLLTSLTIGNVITLRTLVPLVIPIIMLAAYEISRLQPVWKYETAALWTLFLLAVFSTWNPALRGAGLDRVADEIRSQWQPGDVLYYASDTVSLPFDYYLHDLPHYDMDSAAPLLALDDGLMQKFGIQRKPLETIPHRRAWIVMPEDWRMGIGSDYMIRLAHYTDGGRLVATLTYAQISTTKIYLVEEP